MVDGQIKDPSAENPDLSKFLSSNPEAGLNITLHVSPTARKSTFLISVSRLKQLRRACVCACVRACMRVCVWLCVCVCV